jgi:hypothetical protein
MTHVIRRDTVTQAQALDPAPRPVDRMQIALSPEGDLSVDTSIVYIMRPGEDPDEQYPRSLLTV